MALKWKERERLPSQAVGDKAPKLQRAKRITTVEQALDSAHPHLNNGIWGGIRAKAPKTDSRKGLCKVLHAQCAQSRIPKAAK